MPQEILIAACLLLVFEGMLPFISPSTWRAAMLQAAAMSDRQLRITGLVLMLLGVTMLYWLN